MSRLRLFTLKRLFKAFKEGATIEGACKAAGISRTTFFYWTQKWPALGQRVEYLKVSRVPLVLDALFISALKGDVNAQKAYLLNHRQGWRLADPREGVKVQTTVVQQTAITAPLASSKDEEEELRLNADLIRTFKLVDRYGSQEGSGPVPELCVEGQQRPASEERTNSPGDSGTHQAVPGQ